MSSYIKLGIAALLPVMVTVLFYILNQTEKFEKLPHMVKQVIYGVAFGFLAVVGTEWGIPLGGASINCRDAFLHGSFCIC